MLNMVVKMKVMMMESMIGRLMIMEEQFMMIDDT